uniref:TSA: Wollemia nobilis Ref_Wollemi_Transcript_9823_2053 transcribed RNA sequence n=1 Tax=Wollemia nobilis TaxID=56998 RepID=A0A0C9S913_9CONI
MDYDQLDSSGTDDDLPPSHQNRLARVGGRISGNGRSSAGPVQYGRIQNDMEPQIHWLEQEAYISVLRAFKAQSDAITWAKEGLMSELRKELRVSDEEHRELLGRVNADDLLRRIREWRQATANQGGLISTAAPAHDPSPSPSVSASRKKQKTAHVLPSLPMPPQSAMHPLPIAAPPQPSSSTKRGASVGAKNKKTKTSQPMPVVSPPVKPQQFPPAVPAAGRGQIGNRGILGPSGLNEPQEATFDPLIGRRVRTRWPEDNNFYEAVITDYKPEEGLHALVYDMNTSRETWEWVNLKEISPGDILWDFEGPAGSGRGNRIGAGRGIKKSGGRGALVSTSGRGRGVSKGQQPRKDFGPSQNGIGKKVAGDIEILHTETLLKEVERVTGGPHPDPADMEKAKKVLKRHEQSLMDAIARLAEASDGESEDGRHPRPSHPHSVEHERLWRNRQYSGNQHARDDEDDTAGDGRGDGSDGEPMIGEGGVASDDQQDGDEDM